MLAFLTFRSTLSKQLEAELPLFAFYYRDLRNLESFYYHSDSGVIITTIQINENIDIKFSVEFA